MTTKWSEIKRRKDPTGSSNSAENVARIAREMKIAEDAYRQGSEDARPVRGMNGDRQAAAGLIFIAIVGGVTFALGLVIGWAL